MKETEHDDEKQATRPPRAGRLPNDATRRRLFVMRSGARFLAVYADEVEATGENLNVTPLPFAPAPVRGLVSRRGRIFTLIDPLPLLPPDASQQTAARSDGGAQPFASPAMPDTPARAPAASAAAAAAAAVAVVVVALKGDEQLALSVDGVEHEVELYDDEADAPPAAGAESSGSSPLPLLILRRAIPYHTQSVALLDPAHLFDAAMRGVERRRRRT